MDRRELMKLGAGAVAAGFAPAGAAAVAAPAGSEKVEQWGIFETEAHGPASGNPFVDVQFGGRFRLEHRTVDVAGFYDGDGVYKVRFSPDSPGRWSFETSSNVRELAGVTGGFECVAPAKGNRGPVGTAHQFHFQYADGTPYFPFGTTCYSYGFIGEPLAAETLKNLKEAGFNKVRMCLLPKPLGKMQPVAMPFERLGAAQPSGAEKPQDGSQGQEKSDLARLNPEYFRHVEGKILELQAAGIEADVILFHPYDAWGFKAMGQEADDRYLRYAVARLAAFRNVWWSIANEYDLVLVPLIPDMSSVVSVGSIDTFFQHNGGSLPKPTFPHYVLNQFDSSLPLHLDVREILREQLGDRLLPFVLRHSPTVSEALAEGMTVMDYAPNSSIADDFASLAGWVKSLSAPATASFRGVRWSER
jgi:hypothetical protein